MKSEHGRRNARRAIHCEPILTMNLRSLAAPAAVIVLGLAVWYSEWIIVPHDTSSRIHVTYWEKWTGIEDEAMRAVVDSFNRSQDKISVELLTISDVGNKTLLATAGGDPPDVAGLWGANVAQYADDRAILPLDSWCRKYGINRSQYIPVYFDIGFYDGHIYSLPTTPASTALHYNRTLFRNAGLDPDKPPQTLEELDADAAKMMKIRDGRVEEAGFLPAEPGWWNWGWGCVFGGRLWDGKSRITANDPANVRAFSWIQSYPKKFGSTELQTFRSGFGNFSSPQNAFLDSKVAMELQGVWMYNFISKYSPKLEWSAAPFPHPADRPDLAGVSFCEDDILVIPRGAKHPDAAFEFIRYVQSQKGMEMLCLGQRKHSPLSRVSEQFWRQHPNPFIRLFSDQAKSPNAVRFPQIALWPEYQAELSNAFDEVMLVQKTPQEALDEVQERMQPKLDDYLHRMRLRGELR
jgi:ABC-type glycerol-3-phosphate transport system substrate-binding protein